MKKRKGITAVEVMAWVAILAIVLVIAGGGIGYVLNAVKLFQCDFDVPLKAELIRGFGVVMPPVGAVVGWCTINDEPIKSGELK